jgi:hypothetical protein
MWEIHVLAKLIEMVEDFTLPHILRRSLADSAGLKLCDMGQTWTQSGGVLQTPADSVCLIVPKPLNPNP